MRRRRKSDTNSYLFAMGSYSARILEVGCNCKVSILKIIVRIRKLVWTEPLFRVEHAKGRQTFRMLENKYRTSLESTNAS